MISDTNSIQAILQYLNYSGAISYRENKFKIRLGSSQPNTKGVFLERPLETRICLLCQGPITNKNYKSLGKKIFLCSSCKTLFTEITII